MAEELLFSGMDYGAISNYLGLSPTSALVILAVLSVWILVWKGLALWKAANKKSIPWFVILLIFNTFGILEILYIFIFSKISLKSKTKPKIEPKKKIKSKKKR